MDINVSKDKVIDQAFFEQLFEQALEVRQYYYQIEGTNAFRLFNGEGDGVGGLTIDNYDGHLLIQWYSEGIYRFRPQIVSAIKRFIIIRLYMKKRVLNINLLKAVL